MSDVSGDSATNEQSIAAGANAAVCEYCFGTGVEVVVGRGARPCSCRSTKARERFHEAARIPKRYRGCSLHNFYNKDGNESLWAAHGAASKLINDYPEVDKGLLLMGPVGVGKTHLGVAVLRGLMEKGVPTIFYESGSLLKEIQDSYNPISKSSELRVLAPVYEAEVLLLDELGSTVPTDWVRDTLYQIINKRYNDTKLTLFTTNYLDRSLSGSAPFRSEDSVPEGGQEPQKLTDRRRRELVPQTLEERIGARLRSRLYEMCHKVVIDSEDYRQQTKR